MIKLINGDCLEELKRIEDKSINLILIDPPYNIKKAKWDTWKSVDEYVMFMGKVFKELERILKDNGSFYFFHNDFLQIVELQNYINKNTSFKFKQLLVWDKFHGSEWNQLNAIVYSDENRNYSKQAEYALFYTFQEEDRTTELLKECYNPIRKYLNDKLIENNLNYNDNVLINILVNRKIAKNEASAKTILKHKLDYNYKQFEFITLKQYEAFKPILKFDKSYEELKEMFLKCKEVYKNKRYTFSNQGVPSILQHEPIKQNGHITPKPIAILETIIKTSSNEGDTVLDCFMGSGSTGVAAVNTNRNFIGIELDKNYFEIAQQRIKEAEHDNL